MNKIKDYITLMGFVLFVAMLLSLIQQDWNSVGIAVLGSVICVVILLVCEFVEWRIRRAAEIREGE